MATARDSWAMEKSKLMKTGKNEEATGPLASPEPLGR